MEIKFRGKMLDDYYDHYASSEPIMKQGEWVYGYFTRNDENGNCYITNQTKTGGAHPWQVDPKTVGQYTGRKDKNDREIYSGNRLRITIYDFWTEHEIAQEESIVEFRNCKFGVVWRGMFSGLDGFGRNVTFEVIDEEV